MELKNSGAFAAYILFYYHISAFQQYRRGSPFSPAPIITSIQPRM